MTTALHEAHELLLAERANLSAFLPLEAMHAELDRLVEAHPDLVRSRLLGRSREGREIRCYTLGDRGPHAVWYAGPHANEPVGGGTVLYLARRWCGDAELRAAMPWTIHLVPCIDPDGYELNRGWLSGPFTTDHYHRNMHRPAMDEWPDWDFPVAHGELRRESRLPEAIALRELIDDVQPAFLYSLHNGEVGGGFCYVSADLALAAGELCGVLRRAGLPIETAIIEDPSMRPIAPGVFSLLSTDELFDALVASRHADPASLLRHGDAATSYAERRGAAVLVAEVPYWSFAAPAAEQALLRDVIVESADELAQMADWLAETVARPEVAQVPASALMRTLTGGPAFLARQAAGLRQYAAGASDVDRLATPEEIATHRWMLRTAVPQRFRGTLLRVLEGVAGADQLRAEVEREFTVADAGLAAAVGQAYAPGLLAEVQAAAGLVAQAHLAPT